MPRSLTAQDRSSLIRLASTLPAGSPERKAILAGLGRSSAEVRVSLETPLLTPIFEDGDGNLPGEAEAISKDFASVFGVSRKNVFWEADDQVGYLFNIQVL